jgi:hypothetical protein
MNKLKTFAVAAMSAFMTLSLPSCNSGDAPDTITEQTFQQCYAIVTDTQGLTKSASTPVTIKLTLNWSQLTASATITGLEIGSSTYPMLTISDAKWNAENSGWCYTSTSNPTASLPTGSVSVSDFSFRWLDRLDFATVLSDTYDPGLAFSFTIDGRYRVVGSRNPIVLCGTTSTLKAGATEPYTTEQSYYSVKLDFSTNKATISIYNCCFADGMPTFDNMTFEGIDFTVADTGVISMSAAQIEPKLATVPQPSFPVTNLSATLTPGSGMTLQYVCTVMGTPYTANVTLDYTSYDALLK